MHRPVVQGGTHLTDTVAWVQEEMATVDLGHKRRNERLKRLLGDRAALPAASIPAAVGGGRAEREAAYRLFDNEAVACEAVLEPHYQSTLQRVRQQQTVVLAQDTSAIDRTRPAQQVVGAGPLDAGPRRGLFVHPLLALTPAGVPLGSLWTAVWTRDEPTGAPLDAAARKRAAQGRLLSKRKNRHAGSRVFSRRTAWRPWLPRPKGLPSPTVRPTSSHGCWRDRRRRARRMHCACLLRPGVVAQGRGCRRGEAARAGGPSGSGRVHLGG